MIWLRLVKRDGYIYIRRIDPPIYLSPYSRAESRIRCVHDVLVLDHLPICGNHVFVCSVFVAGPSLRYTQAPLPYDPPTTSVSWCNLGRRRGCRPALPCQVLRPFHLHHRHQSATDFGLLAPVTILGHETTSILDRRWHRSRTLVRSWRFNL